MSEQRTPQRNVSTQSLDKQDASAKVPVDTDTQVDIFSTQPHAKSDDKATSVSPKEHDKQGTATPATHTDTVVSKASIDTIVECMDIIHRASIDIPSSDELAQVLLCVQQLKDAIYMYTQAQAQRIVDDTDTDINE